MGQIKFHRLFDSHILQNRKMDGEKDVSDTIPLEANDTNKHQESEHEEADEKPTEDIVDMTLLCGWGKWRPKFLQPLSRPSVFLVVLVVYTMAAGKL